MRPIFTIHAGEFLVGEYIEKNFRELNVWIPTKDTGIDLLVTNSKNTKTISLQVKLSRDYASTNLSEFDRHLSAGGWFTLSHDKIEKSTADIWIFIVVSHTNRSAPKHILISPKDLLSKLVKTHGVSTRYNFYLWVIKSKLRNPELVLDGRGLRNSEKMELINNNLELGTRDYSDFYENWTEITNLSN